MASSGSKLTGTRMLSTYSGSGKKNWNCDWAFPVPYLHEFVFIHIFARIFFYLVKSSGQRYIYSRTIPDNAWSLLRKETNMPNKNLDRQHFMHNFFQTTKNVCLNSSRQGTPLCQTFSSKIKLYTRIFPDSKTHISYAVWMKKLICQHSSVQINIY